MNRSISFYENLNCHLQEYPYLLIQFSLIAIKKSHCKAAGFSNYMVG